MAGNSSIDLDDVTKNLAKQLSDDEHIEALGKAFGITRKEVSRFININYKGRGIGTHGTEQMIETWIEKRPSERSDIHDILTDLRSCLVKAKLVRISETIPKVPKENKEAVMKVKSTASETVIIELDGDGYYKQDVKEAKPTAEQLDETKSYKMDSSTLKGGAFILNNNIFHEKPEKKRNGSDQDMENAKHVFGQIGYEIKPFNDLTAAEIMDELDNLVTDINENAAKYSSVVLVLMSHGGIDKKGRQFIKDSDWKSVNCRDIFQKFSEENCPALEHKPKIIYIQACRGVEDLALVGTKKSAANETETIKQDGLYEMDNVTSSKPAIADMYIMNATAHEFASVRHNVDGSWFIQALCKELLTSAHEDDLDTMMTRVRKSVNEETATMNINGEKITVSHQLAPTETGLLKKVYFLPKYPNDE